MWRAAYALGDGQTSLAYPSNPVQYLYISCYVTANKPVLSYLLLRLLLQWWPRSGCTLCSVPLYTLMLAATGASRSLSRLRKQYFRQILQCALHWLQLTKCFSLSISLRNQQTFSKFVLSVGSWP